MIFSNLSRTLIAGLALCAVGSVFAQARENVGAPVPAATGIPSPLARPVRAPTGGVLVDEFTGRFVTHPTGGFGGAPASAVQTALAMTINGFGAQVLNANALADDFIVPASGWSISRARF
ncbi:MAG: hypothetical protein ABI451_05195, partial [Dokdonella sp.]